MATRQKPAAPHAETPPDRWADLADMILIIAREIQFRGYRDERAVLLTPAEGMVMRHLGTRVSSTPTQIAAATGIQRTNLSALLRDLEAKGLLERSVVPEDRRGVTVQRTKRGAENYALVREEWSAAVAAAANGNTARLDSALELLKAIEIGLTSTRPNGPAPAAARRKDI